MQFEGSYVQQAKDAKYAIDGSKYVIEAELIVNISPRMKFEKVLKHFSSIHAWRSQRFRHRLSCFIAQFTVCGKNEVRMSVTIAVFYF